MLHSEEARRRLAEDGPNVLPSDEPRHLGRLVVDIVREPMLLLLVVAALLYVALGDAVEAGVLGAWVVAMVVMNVVQEHRTELALVALRRLASPRARVVRDGEPVTVPSAEVVRGDTLLVAEGDRVPADARLVEGSHLVADESLLTGESVPVRKVAGDGGDRAPGGEDRPWLWSGTLLVGGTGRAEVTATGARTEIGRIGASLASLESVPTPLQREIHRMVRWFALLGLGACAFLVAGLGLTRGDWLQALLAGIALAMSAIPEEFPVVLTIFYAFGARRMAARKVLTRRTAAVEGLGAVTLLATDKTGTLTENRMTVARLVGGGLEHRVDEGELPEAVHPVVEYGILASAPSPHDPMEVAFHRLGASHLTGTEHLHTTWRPVRDYPLSPGLLAVAHVWQAPSGQDYAVAVKGAVEAVVDLCHLDDADATPILEAARALSLDGLRVLGVGRARFPHEPLPADQHAFAFEFVGLAALQDPVRPDVPPAIAACRAAGIRVVMVTGDAPGTARSIATEAGLGTDLDVVTGPEVEALDDVALRERLRTASIVARAVPDHKLRIVRAFQALGHVVGMTGDGVNDAPALRAADIGVAMGGRGTDVAREAAALVVTDDDFASIVAGIEEGRRIYANLRRATGFILAVHVPAVGLSVAPVLFGWPLILLPFHVAFLELIIDPACSIAFEVEPPPGDLMQVPARDPRASLFSRRMVLTSTAHGAVVLAVCAAAFALSLPLGEQAARGVAFAAVVAGNVGLIRAHRGRSPGFNGVALGMSVVASAAALLVVWVPAVGRFFEIAPAPAWVAPTAMAAAFASAVLAGLLVPVGDSPRVRAPGSSENPA